MTPPVAVKVKGVFGQTEKELGVKVGVKVNNPIVMVAEPVQPK